MSDRVAKFPLQQIARVVLGLALLPLSVQAQYKGDHIPGFLGLDAGTQAPPGLYVGNMVWIYPTNTVNDNAGHNINLLAPITTTATIPLVNVVTNYKILGGRFSGSIAFPFMQNRIELNSLDVNTGFSYTDMFGGVSLRLESQTCRRHCRLQPLHSDRALHAWSH